MNNSFYSYSELLELGFNSIGKNVQISRFARFYNTSEITIGNNVRIDDFCILSGNIQIDDFVHIAAQSALYGASVGIVIHSFANISGKVFIYAISDDYSGATMTNPWIPKEFKHVYEKRVTIQKHVIIGAGSIVLPGVTLYEGSAIGAMSLVKNDTDPFYIYAGIPAVKLKPRKKELLNLCQQFIDDCSKGNN